MVRLNNIVSIDFNDERQAIIEKAKKHKFTRYPVVENRQIKGVINIFDIFYNEGNWHKFIRPIKQVYANQRINQVLYQMQRHKDLISAVVRNGKFIGIISLEDIISEIELI
jgi:CBS domain containing-hemolysin-like protein